MIEAMPVTACPLCKVDTRRILHEDENFIILVPRGPIAAGHILICSKHHQVNFWRSSTLYQNRLESMYQRCEGVLEGFYGTEIVSFEHGVIQRREEHEIYCEHAHRNLVPVAKANGVMDEIVRFFANEGVTLIESNIWGQKTDSCVTDYYYLRLAGRQYVAFVLFNQPISKRIFRRAFATVLKISAPSIIEWESEESLSSALQSHAELQTAFALLR